MPAPWMCRDATRSPSGGRRSPLLDIVFALFRFGLELGVFRAMFAEQALAGMRVGILVERVGQLGLLRAGRARICHGLSFRLRNA